MIKILIDFFKRSRETTHGQTPEGLCPNCWGEQEYDQMFRKMYVDKQIDVNNYNANYAFIQDFVVNRIEGIRLIRGINRSSCPKCGVTVS